MNQLSDFDLYLTKKIYSKFVPTLEYLIDILDTLVKKRIEYKDNWTPQKAQVEKRILSNMIFDQNGMGWRTGYRVVGTDPEKETPEHVYSRDKISLRLMERHMAKRYTLDELERELPILCTTIMVDSEINSKLSTLCSEHKFTLEQLYKMEHYKMLGLKLEPRRGVNGQLLTQNVMKSTRTEYIKSLVVNDPELILEKFM